MAPPAGRRTRALMTHLSPAEAAAVDTARLLDGRGGPLPRSAWLVARAAERLQAHAAGPDPGRRAQALAALAILRLERRLLGTPDDGRKPAAVPQDLGALLAGLGGIARTCGDQAAEAEVRRALAAMVDRRRQRRTRGG